MSHVVWLDFKPIRRIVKNCGVPSVSYSFRGVGRKHVDCDAKEEGNEEGKRTLKKNWNIKEKRLRGDQFVVPKENYPRM